MSKQNDYFLNQLYNPEFSPGDFQSVGLNSGNTSIENKEEYKKLDFVQNNLLLQTDGKFDEKKFDRLYEQSLVGYNLMSNAAKNEKLATTYSAFRDDVFAKSAKRTNESETYITKIANPNRQQIGFVSNNIKENPKQSVREVAQNQLVWDGESNQWVDAPNDTTLNNFFNPKVLAQYDEDVDIFGKTSSEEGFDREHIAHKKGDKKINPLTGTYYYETLNGRDIYGRSVLSGWDTLTRDGSAINKYDFFDSDDLEKSAGGSMLKAALKVAPALIPTIAPWYVGARVLLGATDLFAKVGKMTTGSNSPFLSKLEGINAAWTQQTSDYSQGSAELGLKGHSWSLENLLNLSADVFTQLAEQRWMFTHVPSLIKGNKLGFNKEAQEKFKQELSESIFNKYKGLTDAEALSPLERAIKVQELKQASMWEAQAVLENKLESANKFGEHLSKLYMTGITVADSYGEAKEQGLSDIEAAVFTLGYAAGEYGILNTNLGEHILPELRAEKHRYKNIARTLSQVKEEIQKAEPSPKGKRNLFQKILDFGKQAAYGDFNDAKIASALAANSTTKAFGLNMASNALGEGMEEVSEELWFDVAKALYNGAAELGLTQTGKTMETFDGGNLEQVMNRYALNFVGGLAGGAIAVGLPGFQEGIKNMLGQNMDQKQAYQELVALIRNGKKDDFLRTVKKLEISDSNLSATDLDIIDGQAVYKPGTSENNQDRANKTVLEGMVNLIDNLLTINGVKMDDQSILSKLQGAKNMAQFQTILGGDNVGSATLANYVQRFNTLSTKIADLAMKIDAIQHPRTDQKGEAQQIQNQNQGDLSALQAEMNEAIKERDAYLNGDMAKIIIPKVLFEMSPILSNPYVQTNFKDYAEKVEGRTISEISDTRLKELQKAWENYKNSQYKDDIEYAFQNFMAITEKFSEKLQNFDMSFLQNPQKNFQEDLSYLFDATRQEIMNPINESEDVQSNTQSFEQTAGIAQNTKIQKSMQALTSLVQNINIKDKNTMLGALTLLKNLPDQFTTLEETFGDQQTLDNVKILAQGLGISFDENSEDASKRLKEIKDTYLKSTITEILVNNKEEVKETLKRIPYFNQTTRDFLKDNFLNLVTEYDESGESLDSIYDFDDPEFEEILAKRQQILKEYKDIIDSKPITPIEELVDQFQLSIGDNSHVKMSDLITVLQKQMTQKANQGVIEEFGFGTDIAEQINNGLIIIEAMAANILGARNDGGKLGAVFGFNSTVNQLNPDIKLVEINQDSANTMLQDLSKLKTLLEYFQTIFNVNSGQKLEEQKKIANRVNFSFLKKMRYIVDILLPDDWNDEDESGVGVLDKLKAALDKASTFSTLVEDNNNLNLTTDQAKALEKESIAVQDALYEFFNSKNNKEKILKGEFDLSNFNLLPPVDTEVESYNGTLIDSQLEDFDDRVTVMLLATAASVKASDFYAEYKTSLVDGIAPIPGQELAVKMAYAFLLNKPMFQGFGIAYNNRILEEIKGIDSSKYWSMYGKNVAESGKLDNSYALQFLNTFLVEGVPGAGKTTGFQQVLFNMLNQYHPELLEDVWFVHTSEDKAKAWSEKLGADPNKSYFFDKQSYLKNIYPEYTPLKTNENGVITITENDLEEDAETGIAHLKDVEISKTVKAPSLILFDESTRFSQQEMLISEKFQDMNDVSAIATGDYDQIGAVGQVDKADESKLFLNTSQDNFFHSPKLGTSMRTENTIKDQNIAIAKKNKLKTIKGLIAGTLTTPLINLSFYQDESGLYGERIIEKGSADLDSTITLMLSTLKGKKDDDGNWQGEKVTVIYQDKNSEIYKKLQAIAAGNEEYKGKINFVESSAAQGDEGQYYIVDLKITDIGQESKDNLGNHANFVNTFYTTISRSSQGTLIIENPNIRQIAETSRVNELVKSPLSADAKAKFSKNRIDILSEIVSAEPGKTVLVTKGKKRTDSTDEDSDIPSEGLDTSEEEATQLNIKKVNITNDNPKEYNMLLHSMPSLETGFVQNPDGKYVPSVGYEGRIDGLNGLVKIANTNITKDGKEIPLSKYHSSLKLKSDRTLAKQDQALLALNQVVQAGLYLKDKEEIKAKVKEILGLQLDENEFGVDLLFMFRDTLATEVNEKAKKSQGFLRMLKDKAETLFGIFRGEHTPKKALEAGQNKQFTLNIYRVVDGKRVNILTTPLAIFTNPLTMLETEGFEKFKQEYLKTKNIEKFKETLKDKDFLDTLNTIEKTNADKLYKHLVIYTHKGFNEKNNPHSGDAVVYLDTTLAELAQDITGPTITVKDTKGHEYFHTQEYNYNGEYTDLADIDTSVHHLTKKIYYVPKDIVVNGKTIVKKGRGFVLASDYYDALTDDEMLHLFEEKELNDNPEGRISVIYVSSPKISITDYFKNYALKYKSKASKGDNDPDIDTNIGNELTEFRIAELIAKEGSEYDKYLKELINANPANKTDTLIKWEVFKEVISHISTDFENLNGEQKTALLRKWMKDTSYINLLKYDGGDEKVRNAINRLKAVYGDGKHTLKSFISNTLLNFVIKQKSGFIDEKLSWKSDGTLDITKSISDNISKVEECLPEKFKEGIFTQIKSNQEEAHEIGDYSFIEADAENYENQYGKFRINGKIDSTMFVMDVSKVMDQIINTLEDSEERGTQLNWYTKDTRKHIQEEPKPISAEDLIPKNILDLFQNSTELINLVINNVKEFENCQTNGKLMEILNKLGYTEVRTDNTHFWIVKLPENYLQTETEMFYNLVRDSDNRYQLINKNGEIITPTEEFFNNFSEEKMDNIKKDPETLSNEEDKVLATLYKQIQDSNKGVDSAQDIDSILNEIDALDDIIFTDVDLQIKAFDQVITKEQFKADVKDYIENKKAERLKDTFQEEFQYENINEMLLDPILTAINEAADKYVRC